MSSAWSGSKAGWGRVRRMVLERDGRRCQLRGERCTVIADCVHHTVGRGVTGDDPRHLVAACTTCNLEVGDPRRLDPPPTPRTSW